MSFLALSLSLTLGVGAFLQSDWPGVVDAKDDPAREVLLQNEKVTVVRTELPPGGATRLHAHSGFYLQIALTKGTVSNEVQGRSPQMIEVDAGELRSVSGNFPHVLRNASTTPYRQISVHVANALPAGAAAEPFLPPIESFRFRDGGSGELLEARGARAYIIHIAQGGAFHEHLHEYDYVLIALTDLELQERSRARTEGLQVRAGEVLWRSGRFTHTLNNTGSGPAVFVVVELQ